MKKPLPTLRKVIARLVEDGVITSDDEAHYLANYEYFEQHRQDTEQNFLGKWVASINNELIVGASNKEVHVLLMEKPNWHFAYIEEIGTLL